MTYTPAACRGFPGRPLRAELVIMCIQDKSNKVRDQHRHTLTPRRE